MLSFCTVSKLMIRMTKSRVWQYLNFFPWKNQPTKRSPQWLLHQWFYLTHNEQFWPFKFRKKQTTTEKILFNLNDFSWRCNMYFSSVKINLDIIKTDLRDSKARAILLHCPYKTLFVKWWELGLHKKRSKLWRWPQKICSLKSLTGLIFYFNKDEPIFKCNSYCP